MKKLLFAFPVLCALALFSCKKDKDNAPDLEDDRYIQSWSASATGGEFDPYKIGFDIQPNGTGKFRYYLPASPEVQTALNWTFIAGDSIKVDFTCDDFPEYKFELRALANAQGSLAPGIYYRIKKSDPADRVYRGTLTLD